MTTTQFIPTDCSRYGLALVIAELFGLCDHCAPFWAEWWIREGQKNLGQEARRRAYRASSQIGYNCRKYHGGA